MNKKTIAIGSAAIIAAAAAFGAGHYTAPTKTVTEVKTEFVTKEVPGPVQVQTQIVKEIKYVDSGNLSEVLQGIYDADGDLEYITADLDEDELGLIVERIATQNELRAMAEQAVLDEAMDALDREVVGNVTLDEDEMRKFELDESEVTSIDFDEKDATVSVDVIFRQDGKKYVASFEAEVRNGAVRKRDIDLVSVVLDE